MSTPENTVRRSAVYDAVYLNSIEAAVYRLRKRGGKLPRPKEPREVELMLGLCERGDTRYLKAQLVDAHQDLLAPLMHAQVTLITRSVPRPSHLISDLGKLCEELKSLQACRKSTQESENLHL